ncbi:genetic competence negative regulator [Bacillus tianshenii]|nr:genetic competence negative regulator [Bacillus tianshenii]
MRLERLNYNKIKIFLTFDDLSERGLTQEDLWHDVPKVHQLFRDMMNEASDELGFEADGPIAVEVFSLQAQGMVIIVTKGNVDYDDEDEFSEDYIEMQVTLDRSDDIFYEFATFEDVIQAAIRLHAIGVKSGQLFSFENAFYLDLDEKGLPNIPTDTLIALLAEYGNPATLTTHRVIEYGKTLMETDTVSQLYQYFK